MSLNGELAREDGYGLPLGPCHRPLPGSKAAHIRHPAQAGRLSILNPGHNDTGQVLGPTAISDRLEFSVTKIHIHVSGYQIHSLFRQDTVQLIETVLGIRPQPRAGISDWVT